MMGFFVKGEETVPPNLPKKRDVFEALFKQAPSVFVHLEDRKSVV